MTTYSGTTVTEFERSVESITTQSRPPDEFLIVVDGPVPPELDRSIERASADHGGIRVERLPANVGSGLASARGLEVATGDFLARHDSDDVSLPTRLEREMEAIERHGLDIVGSAVAEFKDTPDQILGVLHFPLTHDEIATRMKFNSPINNPSVIFRRDLAISVGGYADLRYMQDYDLFIRMLAAGARAENLAEPLVLFNAGDGMLSRRGGWGMLRLEWALQRRLRDSGLIGPVLMARNMVVRGAFRLIPSRVLGPVYAFLFRKRAESEVSA